jgi:hypothetical protein
LKVFDFFYKRCKNKLKPWVYHQINSIFNLFKENLNSLGCEFKIQSLKFKVRAVIRADFKELKTVEALVG